MFEWSIGFFLKKKYYYEKNGILMLKYFNFLNAHKV